MHGKQARHSNKGGQGERSKRMASCFAAAVLMLAQTVALAAPPQPLVYDPANPVILNEFAMQKVRDGDLGTALIMLERAVLLAPYDTRIQANLTALRALRAGKLVDVPSQALAKESKKAAETAKPEEPAHDTPAVTDAPTVPLWPQK